ncbi:hypothetical protein [Planomonospora venezuelensis]|uniref:DUF4367 domain-containing protein n=1 Tax=Planomonospora venezuelensis TaxID=1999 RepID=A0A841D5Q4_PLAVE|nr:hypothetical protein [Planomonospora venezuelensis]MBB5963834.1 hypothetical protein [Planomonospora venezuelensis]GIM99621.1 hypothetical protein Pve01_12800 [Planomonospora venezuelensis]
MTSPDEPGDTGSRPPSGEPESRPSSDELESRLLALGDSVEVPCPPPADVARAVRARLEALPARSPQEEAPGADPAGPARRSRRPRALLPAPPGRARPAASRRRRAAAAVVVVLTALFFGATPAGRAAVVQILRLAGVELRIGDPGPLPSGMPAPLPGEERTTLEEARERAAFPIAVPAELGEPGDVRVGDGGRVVSLLWPGVRLDQYDGTLEVVYRKDLGPPWPEEADVDGSQGTWIPAHHGLSYLPREGGAPVAARIAGPTLVWQRRLVGLRLEGVTDRARAVQIARSLR